MAKFKENPRTTKSYDRDTTFGHRLPAESKEPTQEGDREMLAAWDKISQGKKSVTEGGRKIYRPAAVKRAERREEQRKVFEQEFRKQNPMLMEMMDRVFVDKQDVQAAINDAVPEEIRNIGATAQGGDAVLTAVAGAPTWRPIGSLGLGVIIPLEVVNVGGGKDWPQAEWTLLSGATTDYLYIPYDGVTAPSYVAARPSMSAMPPDDGTDDRVNGLYIQISRTSGPDFYVGRA